VNLRGRHFSALTSGAVTGLALLAATLSACTSHGQDATPTGSQSAVSPTTTFASATPGGPPTITLDFGGDVHFTGRTLALLNDPTTALGPISAIFSAADLSMINLESAVTDRGTEQPKQFHFRAPASAFVALKDGGISVATIANNHTLDYGRVGLVDTLAAAKEAGEPIVGAGSNATDAYAPYVATVKGVRIAFIGMSQITELASEWAATDTQSGIAMAFDTNRAINAVKAARQIADVVVVFMHWGQEYDACPIAAQQTLAKQLADAGATMIIGSHVHLLQGDGWLGKTFVAYGMSNFVWWLNDAESNDTGVMRVTLSGSTITKTEFLPAYINRTTGQPDPVTGSEATRISTEYAKLHGCTGLAYAPTP
jgi:poly-gamma-glutamate synthesis protein (capsule biosynthesis protein)